jgi:hypothetical protein
MTLSQADSVFQGMSRMLHMLFVTAIGSQNAPPVFGVPSLPDALWGWLAAFVVLVTPSAVLAWHSHRMLGHWTRYFFQWRRLAWWLTIGGSTALAAGVLGWLGALPAWQSRWQSWMAASQAQGQDPTLLAWLDQTRSHEVQLLDLFVLALTVGGVVVTALGFWQMMRSVLVRRQPVAASTEWMMAPPVTRSHDW